MTTDTQAAPEHVEQSRPEPLFIYFLLGTFLGTVFVKSEVASWFRIQEMFHFASVHMYGIIGGALVVATISIAIIKARRIRTVRGDQIVVPQKQLDRGAYRYWIGGTIFGLGWALAGACPGPIFALLGNGYTVFLVNLAAAVMGAWVYGVLRPRLLH